MGEKPAEAPAWFKALFVVAALGLGVWWMRSSSIEKQVAQDAQAQYEIVKKSGGAIERCAQAGMVSAAWLQAKDAERYEEWKQIESTECRNAGIQK